jgi:hypothetical protein
MVVSIREIMEMLMVMGNDEGLMNVEWLLSMIQYQHAYDFEVHPDYPFEIDFSSASLQASHTCKVNNLAKGFFHIQKMLHICCMMF